MAETTWKQAVYDIANAYREAEGTSDKISIANLKEKVRDGGGKVYLDGERIKQLEMTSYKGDNPLTLGADGATFDTNVLLKNGLTIINGVSGEDLTETASDQTLAVEELKRMVARKVSENRGEGEYVWKKLTAEGGDFIDYVVNSDETAYPDGGTQDGYWYELLSDPVDLVDETDLIAENIREGVDIFGVLGTMSAGADLSAFGLTKVETGEITTGYTFSLTIPHSLGKTPKFFFVYGYHNSGISMIYNGLPYGFGMLGVQSGAVLNFLAPTLTATSFTLNPNGFGLNGKYKYMVGY